jgi:hypothetical protein
MPETVAEAPSVIDLDSGDLTMIRLAIISMVTALNKGPKSRARSLVVTKLEEASMWASEAMRTE